MTKESGADQLQVDCQSHGVRKMASKQPGAASRPRQSIVDRPLPRGKTEVRGHFAWAMHGAKRGGRRSVDGNGGELLGEECMNENGMLGS